MVSNGLIGSSWVMDPPGGWGPSTLSLVQTLPVGLLLCRRVTFNGKGLNLTDPPKSDLLQYMLNLAAYRN